MHDRNRVIRLQQAHAGYIEAVYRQALAQPGNPEGIEILTIGATRVFLSGQDRLENRAIFTGNETIQELGEISACFDRKGVAGFFEINPANFYRSAPFSWHSEMLLALLDLGFHPGAFRCVWALDAPPPAGAPESPVRVRRFTSGEVDAYLADWLLVEPVEAENVAMETRRVRSSFNPAWVHFIGYEGDRPASLSRLFMNGATGYLAWGYTAKAFRRRGHHRAHVMARARHAFEAGLDLVFSVTDFNVASSFSLQQAGFSLAYNYLLMERQAGAGGGTQRRAAARTAQTPKMEPIK